MSTITIVTVWNQQAVFAEFLRELQQQKEVDYVLLDVDNSQNQFRSARQAFNAQLDRVETELVMFLHQDIRFLDAYSLRDLVNWVEMLPQFGVVGVAGCPEGKHWRLLSSIVHGEKAQPAGETVNEPIPVQTLDECLFVMRSKDFRELPFSNLEGWHMYAVEQCMELRRLGRINYVIPARIWHLSKGGSLDPSYLSTLEVLVKRYRTETKYLNTTVKQWKTAGLGAWLYRAYYLRKQKLKRFLLTRIPQGS